MGITLVKTSLADCHELYDLQMKAFKELVEKYQDFETNPGAEKIEKTIKRVNQSNSHYYFICLDDKHIGAIRIACVASLCKLKQMYILPEYQGQGYAQQTILAVERLFPDATRWELSTIKQEEKLCHLYEKMGYKKTGVEKSIKDGMDKVYFSK